MLQAKLMTNQLPRGVYTGTAQPLTVIDPIYPRKSEVSRGSWFSFHGHRNPRSTLWIVEDIITLCKSESGRFIESSVHNVRMLDDVVVLRCEGPFQKKRITFRHLSYSAAWRLEH